LDSNSFLLNKAHEKFPESYFITADILDYNYELLQQKFDLVVLFGVMHHIPGCENRVKLLSSLKKLLSPQGLLIFSTWDFLEYFSLKERIQSWAALDLENQVEKGDYLLNWEKGSQALRYCHHFTDKEVTGLCLESSLKILKTYTSSTSGDRYNKYFITSL